MTNLFERLLKFTGDGVYRYDIADGTILMANDGLARILDFDGPGEQLVGRKLRDVMVYIEREGSIRRALVDEGEIHAYPYRFRTLKGEPRWVLHDSFVLRDAESGRSVVDAIVKDITALKQAQQAIEDERERLLVTLRCIGDAVIAADAQGQVTLLNPVAETLTGWNEPEAAGKPLQEVFRIVNEHTRQPCENPVDRVFREGRVVGLANHTVLLSRYGNEFAIADSAAPIRDAQGKVTGAVLVFRDVTEQRRLALEQEQANRMDALGLLAGGIAHDFNNILCAILGNVALASSRAPAADNELHDLLKEVERAALRSRDLTAQLLTFAKGGAPIRKASRLPEIIRESATFALHGAASRCEFEIDDDLWSAEVDAGQISQVIQNLVINAHQAMPGGGAIRVRAENRILGDSGELPLRGGRYVVLAISDEGTGIPHKYLNRIFDPYFTTKQRGSGLGLSTTFSILKQHDGHITVRSVPGRGAVFQAYLPAMDEPAPAPPEAEDRAPGQRRGRVLVMDDEHAIRRMLARQLNAWGLQTDTAADGQEALNLYGSALAESRPYDAVILDLTVPGGMGGRETLQRIRDLDPGVRAIASSGYSNDPILNQPGQYGFAAVAAKPYHPAELRRVLSRVLDAPR